MMKNIDDNLGNQVPNGQKRAKICYKGFNLAFFGPKLMVLVKSEKERVKVLVEIALSNFEMSVLIIEPRVLAAGNRELSFLLSKSYFLLKRSSKTKKGPVYPINRVSP